MLPFGISGIAWDACCLLTLLATGKASAILDSLAVKSYVTRYVAEREVLSLRHIDEQGNRKLIDVSLQPLVDNDLLEIVDLSPIEQALFVTIAADLDDGESQTIAIALQRSLMVATDDGKALKWMRRQVNPVAAIETPDWLHLWATSEKSGKDVRRSILSIESDAIYKPPRLHPLKGWWDLQKNV